MASKAVRCTPSRYCDVRFNIVALGFIVNLVSCSSGDSGGAASSVAGPCASDADCKSGFACVSAESVGAGFNNPFAQESGPDLVCSRIPIDVNDALPIAWVGMTPVGPAPDYRPVCRPGDPIAGLRADFALVAAPSEATASDALIREGDVVGGADGGATVEVGSSTLGPGNFELRDEEGESGGLTVRSARTNVSTRLELAPTDVQFSARRASRSGPVALAVVVDNSGSMRGRVDPDSYFELASQVATALQVAGASSDPNRERFGSLANNLMSRLGPEDRLFAYFTNDDGVHLACTAPSVDAGAVSEAERFCSLPENRGFIVAPPGAGATAFDAFSTLFAGEGTVGGVDVLPGGRTPLWTAVNHAWDALQALEAPEDTVRHIVVFSDSPDTCNPTSSGGSWWVPSIGCSPGIADAISGYASFLDKVDDFTADAENPVVPISFIQLQSAGYLNPDPAQLQMACMTGGSHQFINAQNIAKNSGTDFVNGINAAVDRIWYSLGGVWHLYLDEEDGLGSLAPSDAYAVLSGELIFDPEGSDRAYPASATSTYNLAMGNSVDRRVPFPLYCEQESACIGGSDTDCVRSCVEEGSACNGPMLWSSEEPVESFVTSEQCCCGVTGSFSQPGFCFWDQEPCCSTGGEHLYCQ